MAQTVGNVTAGKPAINGAVWRAPKGTTLPIDASTALSDAFKSLGYCSDAGLTNSNAPSTSFVRAWGKDVVLTLLDEKNDTFRVTLIEALNDEVQKAVYGADNVSGALSTGITVTANNGELESHVIVIDTILKGGVMQRTVIPAGTVSEVGDITYKDDEAVGFETTVSCEADASGNTHYTYIQS